MVDEVWVHMKEMLEVGAICPIQSPWCNVVVLVCKKDIGLHFCIDFCKLNSWTKKVSYPFPEIQEAIESLMGVGYFSCLDLKVGFWQITMGEASKQYTAFTMGNQGFFECECMPFRQCNVPTMFQRLMQNCLGELNLTYCLIHLDDVIVFSKTEEHNLKLKPTKCEFFQNEINYLAHHVSKERVRSSKENLKDVVELHGNLSLSELGGALLAIHQGVCMYSTIPAWKSIWERC